MKHINISLFLFVLMHMVSIELKAYDISAENEDGITIYYHYINDNKELEVTGANLSHTKDVKIPEQVNVKGRLLKVTSIDSGAFQKCSDLTSVTIPNSVTSIGSSTFYSCSSLTSVTIPNSVTSIGNRAFWGCSSLTSVTIPNSVTSIGSYAFHRCSGLTSVTISNSVTSIGYMAFYDCSSLTSVTIPNSVTSIGGSAFEGCSSLTSVTIPNSVTTIESFAFSGCGGLNSVTIPNSVTSIENGAFSGCSSLNSVTIPNSVTSIGNGAFSGCSSLTSVTISNSVTSIGYQAFYDCSSLILVVLNSNNIVSKSYSSDSAIKTIFGDQVKEYVIGEDVTSIGRNAFIDCNNLTVVTMPCSLTSISDGAFNGCSSLTSVIIPQSVTSIGYQAFRGCSGLTSVNIPNSVTYIGKYAFYQCSNLTSVMLDDGDKVLEFSTSYSDGPFSSCPLESVYLGRNIKYDSYHSPFSGISSITSLMISNSLTSISDGAFSGCRGLTSISIPNSVTEIGSNAFSSCSGLTSVMMPDNIMSIGDKAFDCKTYVNKGSKTLLTFWQSKNLTPYDKATDKEILPSSFNISPTTQTTASVKIENWCDGYTYIYNGETAKKGEYKYTKLKPGSTTSLKLEVLKDDAHYDVNGSFTTQSLLPRIEKWTVTSSSISATGAYTEDDAKVVGHCIRIADNEAVDGNQCFVSGLNPGRNYTAYYTIEVDYGGTETATYTGTKSIHTAYLQFSMAQPKVVSEGNVIVSASANLDENEENVGFEWRCTDWTDEFPSNTGTAYLYDGTIEGYIKNMNTSKLWKCRPYYLSNSGVYHYGDWTGIDPTNTSYFEPTVHTYSKVTIKGNTALVRGYALSGTDEVKVQGFKYWRTGKGGGIHHKVIAVPTDAITVELNNKQQTLTTTLSDLEYASEYCCVAFVTTTDGSTFYGEEQTFITGEAPSDIESVEAESTSDESVIEVARYNIDGQQISAPQKGMNIIRYSNGTTKKVYVR